MKKWSKWLGFSVIFILVLSLAACGGNTKDETGSAPTENSSPDKTSDGGQLVVVSWGGAYQDAQRKAMFEPFKQETGVNLVEDSPVDIGKLKAMVKGENVQWDVVDVLGMDVPKLVSEDLLEPIDYTIVDKTDMLESAVGEYNVDIDYYSTVLSYNNENLPNGKAPESWADFFDKEKFPGTRALYKSPITTLEIALLADGVAPDQLYPLDVDRAFNKLDSIKNEIVWWEQGAQPVQLLSDKEVVMAVAWNGRIASAAKEGQPLAFTYDDGILDSEAWVVPKGAKNKETAMKFIQFASQGKPQAELLNEIPYGPTNKKAFDFMEESYARSLPTYPDNFDKQIILDVNWWNDNFETINDRFQEWLLK
ncbi:extracellular solute-binding protein [Microaerobacter geothermalis]|uniref:ABC transporter substrate-binding protein n=1 Tax=Microaerobacter geothermalis TaxID=674972 RepID=UPI001F306D54|nr:ABC transporter substrate-binding protein [Microaerobacter geothermalis]MCF6093676.1 extracellular solute-binding protein [Microaerobacter geothermalis]